MRELTKRELEKLAKELTDEGYLFSENYLNCYWPDFENALQEFLRGLSETVETGKGSA